MNTRKLNVKGNINLTSIIRESLTEASLASVVSVVVHFFTLFVGRVLASVALDRSGQSRKLLLKCPLDDSLLSVHHIVFANCN